ncbi:MAG: hypothetical protein U5K38_05170 [Woeseiaceae bacterium]|nr:hypothetical protein [Woeseiaceae bacterium]
MLDDVRVDAATIDGAATDVQVPLLARRNTGLEVVIAVPVQENNDGGDGDDEHK